MKLNNLLFSKELMFIILCILPFEKGRAQSLLTSNPADANDSKTLFTNPAIISFQNPQIILGMQAFHLGVIENNTYGLRSNFLGIVLPNLGGKNIDIGLVGQYFDTPIFDEGHFGLEISRRFFSRTSVGLKIGFISQSYDKNKFDLVDENDPVFANSTSKTALSLGVGFLFYPTPKLALGAAVDHLNQPDLSLVGENIKQPLIASIGIKYNFIFIRPFLGLTFFRNEATPNFSLESYASDWGSVRFGYVSNNIKVEGFLYLIGGMNLNYAYEYPLSDLSGVTGGSHLISFIYNFKGGPGLARWAEDKISQRHEAPELTGIFIDSEVDTLDIIKTFTTRIIEPTITLEEIAHLPASILGPSDSTILVDYEPLKFKPLVINYKVLPEEKDHPQKYREFMKVLSNILLNDKNLTVNIVSDSSSASRALNIQNDIAKTSDISSDRIKLVTPTFENYFDSLAHLEKMGPNRVLPAVSSTALSPKVNRFSVKTKGVSRETKNWFLEIRTSEGKDVTTLTGKDYIPAEILWNWSNDIDAFKEPGHYYFRLKWQDTRNRTRQSREWSFFVREIHRRISLKVGKGFKGIDEADQIFIYLQ